MTIGTPFAEPVTPILSAVHLETLRALRTNAESRREGPAWTCLSASGKRVSLDDRVLEDLRELKLIARVTPLDFFTPTERGGAVLELADKVGSLTKEEQTQSLEVVAWTTETLTKALARDWYKRDAGGFVARIGSVRVVTRKDESAFANDRIVVDVHEGDGTLTVNAAAARALAAALLRAAALAELEIATLDGGS